MIKNKDIIIVGYQSWDISIGSNCKNIAYQFAKHNRVLYVNLPIDRRGLISKKKHDAIQLKRIAVLNGESESLEVISDQFWSFYPKTVYESINWIKISMLYDFFNCINAKRISKEIKRAIEHLNFKDYILFNDSDMFRGVYFKELLAPAFNIYYIRDNLISQPYFKKHGAKTEIKTIKSADMVVTNSIYLKDYALPHNKNTFYVGQGCDLSQYKNSNTKLQKDVTEIKGLKIGYIGYLTQMRLDISLLIEIALLRPKWQLILVGPEDSFFKNSELHNLNNVHFLGQKNTEELPAYINSFDVCINPQLVNDMTIGNYPRKIDEYLAIGKPVVATKTPTMAIFESVVSLGTNTSEYISLIEKLIREDNLKKQNERIAFAQSHSWENSVKEIAKAYYLITSNK
jgi:glycosyltransferase involved in cell wall biosynthesis